MQTITRELRGKIRLKSEKKAILGHFSKPIAMENWQKLAKIHKNWTGAFLDHLFLYSPTLVFS